jgi:hypothetical protein
MKKKKPKIDQDKSKIKSKEKSSYKNLKKILGNNLLEKPLSGKIENMFDITESPSKKPSMFTN